MQLDYYPNPRAYPHHLEKNIKPRFARKNKQTGLRPMEMHPLF